MTYIKKSYCFKNDKMRVFSGHITQKTVHKHGFDSVVLSVFDSSGKGRGENRIFNKSNFDDLKPYS